MPLTGYNANFTVGATIAGFDVQQSGYSETNSANATIRAIPWANPPDASHYAIVIQVGGLQPRNRPYRVTIYTEAAYGTLRSLVGQLGVLTTPREAAAACMLNKVSRGSLQDPNSITGPQTLELEFMMTV